MQFVIHNCYSIEAESRVVVIAIITTYFLGAVVALDFLTSPCAMIL